MISPLRATRYSATLWRFPQRCESFRAIPGNRGRAARIHIHVKRRLWPISILFVAASLAGLAYDDYASARKKLDSIEAGRLAPGARVTLTYP